MELDWTTVVLEAVNFIVLVWLLKRFLYRPVLAVVEERQAKVQATIAQAEATRTEAEALQKQYAGRLETWESEKQEKRRILDEELAQERGRQMEALHAKLEQEEGKVRASRENQNRQWRRETSEQALKLGAGFAAALLKSLADEHLESQLITLFCERVGQWPAERLAPLRNGNGRKRGTESRGVTVHVASAYPLTEVLEERLRNIIREIVPEARAMDFGSDPSLIAGLRITAGGYILGLNLADELQVFAEAHHTSTGSSDD